MLQGVGASLRPMQEVYEAITILKTLNRVFAWLRHRSCTVDTKFNSVETSSIWCCTHIFSTKRGKTGCTELPGNPVDGYLVAPSAMPLLPGTVCLLPLYKHATHSLPTIYRYLTNKARTFSLVEFVLVTLLPFDNSTVLALCFGNFRTIGTWIVLFTCLP